MYVYLYRPTSAGEEQRELPAIRNPSTAHVSMYVLYSTRVYIYSTFSCMQCTVQVYIYDIYSPLPTQKAGERGFWCAPEFRTRRGKLIHLDQINRNRFFLR